MDAGGEREARLDDAAPCIEMLRAPGSDLGIERNRQRRIDIIGRALDPHVACRPRRSADLADRRIIAERNRHRAIDADTEVTLDAQLARRLLHHHATDMAEITTRPRARDARCRREIEIIILKRLPCPFDRLQPQIAAREGHRKGIAEARFVADLVQHQASVMPDMRRPSLPCRKKRALIALDSSESIFSIPSIIRASSVSALAVRIAASMR